MGFMSKKQQPTPGRRSAIDPDSRTRANRTELDARYSFRRNRTLTGSLSSDVPSANEHNSELKSARVHTHHLRKHRRRATGALVVVFLGVAILCFMILQSIVKVQVATTADVPDSSAYEQKIHDYLMRRPMERFRFSVNTEALAIYLQSQGMPEVKSVSEDVDQSGIGGASFSLLFRRPVVAWQTAGVKLYVDGLGNSFQRNYYEEPPVQVIDQTGIQTQNNQVLASNRFLGFIGKVVGKMNDNGFKVSQIVLPASTTRQVQVMSEGVAYPIKFSVDRSAGEQAEDAARAIKYLQSKNITPEYLDVRVSGKAYYK